MATCAYCNQPGFADGRMDPCLCEQHLDLTLLAGRLLRREATVTAAGLERMYQETPPEIRKKLSFDLVDIDRLFRQALEKGFDLSYRAGSARILVGEKGKR